MIWLALTLLVLTAAALVLFVYIPARLVGCLVGLLVGLSLDDDDKRRR